MWFRGRVSTLASPFAAVAFRQNEGASQFQIVLINHKAGIFRSRGGFTSLSCLNSLLRGLEIWKDRLKKQIAEVFFNEVFVLLQ